MSKRTNELREGKPGPEKITYEQLVKAFGGDVKKMEAFAAGCRKAYSTGQPGDEPEADTNVKN